MLFLETANLWHASASGPSRDVALQERCENAGAFRPDPEIVRRLPVGYAVQLVGFFSAAAMYARLYSGGRGIIEGLRFGALIGLLVSFVVVWNYVTQPISVALGVAEAFEYVVASTIYAAIIGAVYRPPITR